MTTGAQVHNPSDMVSRVHTETMVAMVIVLVALGVRAASLGIHPLSAAEADQAIAAWRLVDTSAPGSGVVASPLIYAGMALSFMLGGLTDAAARVIPMLAGLGLVLAPLLFKKHIGLPAALAAMVWLALSPTAVYASRTVNGTGLALLTMVLGVVAVRSALDGSRQALLWAGTALAGALLADYGTMLIFISMAMGFGFTVLTDDEGVFTRSFIREALAELGWKHGIAGFLGTLLLLGTLFFIDPSALGTAANQITRFLGGIIHPIPAAPYLGFTLSLYEWPILVFGLIGAWRSSLAESPWQRFLAGWSIAALLLSLLYRGALPVHALWAVVPLSLLAGTTVVRIFTLRQEGPRWVAPGLAAVTLALCAMVFSSIMLHLRGARSFTTSAVIPADFPVDLILAGLWVSLLFILSLTVFITWGSGPTLRGLGSAALILGLAVNAGTSVRLAFTEPGSPFLLLNVAPAQSNLTLLVSTSRDIGDLTLGSATQIPIAVQGKPEGALAWALRDFLDVTYMSRVDPTVNTMLAITPAGAEEPALGSSYVGQDFVIGRSWSPAGQSLKGFVLWLFLGQGETQSQADRVILWVREDVYRLSVGGPAN